MNLPLSTFLIFLFLIPGILYRRFYYSEEFSKQYFKESFFGVFSSTFLPSLVLHSIGLIIVNLLTSHYINLNVVIDLVSKNPSESTIENVNNNIYLIIIYNFLLSLLAGLIGYLLRKIVRLNKLDREWKAIRFRNSWHYIVKGEFFDFDRANIELSNDTVEDIEFVFVSALVEVKESTFIYDGILVDYELNDQDSLNYITITASKRRKITDDCEIEENIKKDNSNNYYPIEGHILLLKYSEIKNLNFTYYTLERETENYYIRRVE